MTGPDPTGIAVHEDEVLFREAVNFTAARTGFAARLVEKDYFCTLLLAGIAEQLGERVVFKGGTCLAKVTLGFYRLSEDLDFTIPLAVDATRAERREAADPFKSAIANIPEAIAVFNLLQPPRGANQSTQYVGALGYESPTTGQAEAIRVEASLREPLRTPVLTGPVRAMLLHPIGGGPMVAEMPVPCISQVEALAEKFRAALTRREVAIRDFYDLDHAVRALAVDVEDAGLVELVRQKLSVPGNDPVDVGQARLGRLHSQLAARLRPVLRQEDYDEFALDRAIAIVIGMAERVA